MIQEEAAENIVVFLCEVTTANLYSWLWPPQVSLVSISVLSSLSGKLVFLPAASSETRAFVSALPVASKLER